MSLNTQGKRAFWEVRKTVGRIRVHHRPFADLLHNQNLFRLFILVLCESHTLSSLTSSSGPYLYQLRQEFMQYYTDIYIMPHKRHKILYSPGWSHTTTRYTKYLYMYRTREDPCALKFASTHSTLCIYNVAQETR